MKGSPRGDRWAASRPFQRLGQLLNQVEAPPLPSPPPHHHAPHTGELVLVLLDVFCTTTNRRFILQLFNILFLYLFLRGYSTAQAAARPFIELGTAVYEWELGWIGGQPHGLPSLLANY